MRGHRAHWSPWFLDKKAFYILFPSLSIIKQKKQNMYINMYIANVNQSINQSINQSRSLSEIAWLLLSNTIEAKTWEPDSIVALQKA